MQVAEMRNSTEIKWNKIKGTARGFHFIWFRFSFVQFIFVARYRLLEYVAWKFHVSPPAGVGDVEAMVPF